MAKLVGQHVTQEKCVMVWMLCEYFKMRSYCMSVLRIVSMHATGSISIHWYAHAVIVIMVMFQGPGSELGTLLASLQVVRVSTTGTLAILLVLKNYNTIQRAPDELTRSTRWCLAACIVIYYRTNLSPVSQYVCGGGWFATKMVALAGVTLDSSVENIWKIA